MKFSKFDTLMRNYETDHDRIIPEDTWIIARLDGRGFTKLTKQKLEFERPFDVRFRDVMVETTRHLMDCGFRIVFGYTQSDEISLLFDFNEDAFKRKSRKINSLLAGEASAYFSLELEMLAVFDCRICEIPDKNTVVDYFRWRQEDSRRNSLNAHGYWKLRSQGLEPNAADQKLMKLSPAAKTSLLKDLGVNFEDLPLWQKNGIGLRWIQVEKPATNPMTGEDVIAKRNILESDLQLPTGQDYSNYLNKLF